jgi:hypothetical protein
MQVIWAKREREYFCKGDWTASISLIRFNKLGWARRFVGVVVEDGLSPSRNPSPAQAAIDGYRFAPPILRAAPRPVVSRFDRTARPPRR